MADAAPAANRVFALPCDAMSRTVVRGTTWQRGAGADDAGAGGGGGAVGALDARPPELPPHPAVPTSARTITAVRRCHTRRPYGGRPRAGKGRSSSFGR